MMAQALLRLRSFAVIPVLAFLIGVLAPVQIRGAQTDKVVDQASSKSVSSLEKILQWYQPAGYDPDTRMLFVETKNPSPSVAHARTELLTQARIEIRQVARSWLGDAPADWLKITDDQVFEELVFQGRVAYAEDVINEVKAAEETGKHTKLFKGYMQLELNNEFENQVREQSLELVTRTRLVQSGLVWAAVLSVIALTYGYLKLETATRGFYSRRLQTVFVIFSIFLLTLFLWLSQRVA